MAVSQLDHILLRETRRIIRSWPDKFAPKAYSVVGCVEIYPPNSHSPVRLEILMYHVNGDVERYTVKAYKRVWPDSRWARIDDFPSIHKDKIKAVLPPAMSFVQERYCRPPNL